MARPCQFGSNSPPTSPTGPSSARSWPTALAAATQLRDLGWGPAADAYGAAWTLARCVPVVEKDDKLDAPKRQAEMQFYADQAMAMLRDAVAKGYKNAAQMKKDKDLD